MTSVFHHHADVAPLLIATPTLADIDALYSATHWSLTDMPALLDPRVDLEWLAQTAHTHTVQRFGYYDAAVCSLVFIQSVLQPMHLLWV